MLARLRRAWVLALAVISGCLSASAPLRTVQYRPPQAEPQPSADVLIVMLPGMGDSAEDYQSHGFIEQLQKSGVDADVVAVDAHFGYYQRRDLLPRLREDVFEPARIRGYDSIWLVGISLGGFGAMLAAQEFHEDVDGLVVLSPFLGTSRAVRRIENAGGITRWTPPPQPDNFTEDLWSWIKGYQSEPEDRPPMFLAYGDDEPGFSHAMLGEVLPSERVFVEPGKHGWITWQKLWPMILEKRPFDATIDAGTGEGSALADAPERAAAL